VVQQPVVYPTAPVMVTPVVPAFQQTTTTVVTTPVKEYRSDVVQTRVFLQPIAPPQPLGLWGFSIGTFLIGSYLAGWYGTSGSLSILAPFVFFAGGLLQLIACWQGFRARCAYSTVAFGIWSALFFAFALLWFFVMMGLINPVLGTYKEFAIWWVPLIVLSLMLTGAALLENLGIMVVYLMVSIASILMAASYFWHYDNDCASRNSDNNHDNDCTDHGRRLRKAAGYFFVFAAAAAMYTGLWFLLSFMSGRDLIPNKRFKWAEKRPRIHGGENEPGVKKCM